MLREDFKVEQYTNKAAYLYRKYAVSIDSAVADAFERSDRLF